MIAAISGLVVALVVGVVVGLSVGLTGSAAFGLAFGLAAGFAETAAWVYFAAALLHLGLRRKVPWQLMAFLDDAHVHRGVLRQVGTIYSATSPSRPPAPDRAGVASSAQISAL